MITEPVRLCDSFVTAAIKLGGGGARGCPRTPPPRTGISSDHCHASGDDACRKRVTSGIARPGTLGQREARDHDMAGRAHSEAGPDEGFVKPSSRNSTPPPRPADQVKPPYDTPPPDDRQGIAILPRSSPACPPERTQPELCALAAAKASPTREACRRPPRWPPPQQPPPTPTASPAGRPRGAFQYATTPTKHNFPHPSDPPSTPPKPRCPWPPPQHPTDNNHPPRPPRPRPLFPAVSSGEAQTRGDRA